jgi:hypothetical protein
MPAGPIGSSWVADSWEDTAWEANSWADLAEILESGDHLNDRMLTYLRFLYSSEAALTPLVLQYLEDEVVDNDYTAAFKQLISAATEFTT